ncbi:MAG: histidinol-phosphate transaminase [Thermodesulfobacteriota bacterium]
MVKSSGKKLNISVPEGIASLTPYPPGKPIEELERELGIEGSIKLASNENPLGPSRKAVEAISGALGSLNRYPDGSCYYLKQKLSERLGVAPEMIIPGNGSNEVIELIIRTFLRPGDEVLMGDPSFAVYPLVVQAAGGEAVRVDLKGLTIDLQAMAERLVDKTRVVFISNPNNPTGTIVTSSELDRFMEAVPDETIVCIDEAYYEYVTSPEFPDALKYIREGRPVVLLRTFSKIYGLAGLRIGYGVARPDIVDYMDRVRQPFNVNSLAMGAALAALDDAEHVESSRENNATGLAYLFEEIEKLGCECVPTEANFFLVKVGDGEDDGGAVYDGLLKKGVIVRPMKGYGLGRYIRVTVGLPEENRRFVEAFKQVTECRV